MKLRERILRSSVGLATWGELRRRQLESGYRARRERYAEAAERAGLFYSASVTQQAVRDRLARRGYTPLQRDVGDVHTFAFIPRIGWHDALFGDLQRLGPVSEFDYTAIGYRIEDLLAGGEHAAAAQREINRLAVARLEQAHSAKPVDWVFVYASGLEIRAETVRRITEKLGIPVVNMCLDDKQSWTGPPIGGQRRGQVDIASAFDLSWTSARVACEWYLAEGARPVYLPEGFDAARFRPIESDRDIPISFVGGAYGFRPRAIRRIRRARLPVSVFGPGWGTAGVWGEDQVKIFNRSSINLGMGGIGYSEWLTNVKTRDFEIPGTGGGMYLTSYNPDLALHFDVGREIVCYRNPEELVELLRYHLQNEDESREIAERARNRCLREHQWLHRYIEVCRILGITSDTASQRA